MKFSKGIFMAMGLMASLLLLNSCDSNNDYIIVQRPTALVTVYPDGPDAFTMQLDDSTTLFPSNMKASPYGNKKVRALVNYTVDPDFCGDNCMSVHVNWIDSIRTKQPVVSMGSSDDDAKAYGNDPIEIVRDWVTVAEDGYVTLRIRTLWGGKATHIVNLVGGVNKDNVCEFDLRHDARGDVNGTVGDALIAFDLNSFWTDHSKEVKIKLNWLSFSGKKSIELPLKMHAVSSETVADAPSLLRRIE